MTQTTSKLDLRQMIAMGVGGMVGGGIFSVLGLAIAQAGHAAPIAFVLGGVIALLTGYSYAKLGIIFHSDGGSFTYLEKAFKPHYVAGIGGWLLLAGYIGTLALYAFTFGVYGAAMLGGDGNTAMHHLLESFVLLLFLGINLYGVRETGNAELLIVTAKVLILGLFAVIGLVYIKADHVLPIFNHGEQGVLMAAALIFVAYEGFELIPNAINEMEDPQHNLIPAIMWSIGIAIFIYITVSLVAVGNLLPEEVIRYKEYALAVAAKPFLGDAGFLLIGLAALFSTSSAINATLFGTARLGSVMAKDKALPAAFGFRRKQSDIPWVSLLVITSVTLVFVNTSDLTLISSFASATFLLIFSAINLSAFRLRKQIDIGPMVTLSGLILSFTSLLVLLAYLWQNDSSSLSKLVFIYVGVVVAELLFSQRRCLFKTN